MSFFSQATRKKAKLRLAVAGGPGAGKTFSALEIALGIASSPDKVFGIDTERHSMELYSNKGGFQVGCLDVSFDPMLYVKAIHEAEQAGAEVILIDSLTHAWEGAGGILEQVDANQSRNKFTAWKDVTPKHKALVDAMLQSPCHIVATMRTKVEYVLEQDSKGRQVPKKVGMKPIQREGMDYEFTVVLDMNESHMATAGKDRTGILDGKVFQPSQETGRALLAWLDEGQAAPPPVQQPRPGSGNEQVMPLQQDPGAGPPQGDVQEPPPGLASAFEQLTQLQAKIDRAPNKEACGLAWNAIIAAKNEGIIDVETSEELKAKCKAKAATFNGA